MLPWVPLLKLLSGLEHFASLVTPTSGPTRPELDEVCMGLEVSISQTLLACRGSWRRSMALFRRLGRGHQSLPVHRSEPNQIICNNFLATLTQSWRLACQIMAQTQGKVRMDTAAWTSQRVDPRRGDFEHPAELLPAMEPGPRLAAGHAATPSGYRQASVGGLWPLGAWPAGTPGTRCLAFVTSNGSSCFDTWNGQGRWMRSPHLLPGSSSFSFSVFGRCRFSFGQPFKPSVRCS